MLYTDNTIKAMQLTYKQHRDHIDKQGIPFCFRLFALAEKMRNEKQICTALLSSIMATGITREQLEEEFGSEIAEAIETLYQNKQNYDDYIQKIASNDLARKVKIADLQEKIALLTKDEMSEDEKRKLETYRHYFVFLSDREDGMVMW